MRPVEHLDPESSPLRSPRLRVSAVHDASMPYRLKWAPLAPPRALAALAALAALGAPVSSGSAAAPFPEAATERPREAEGSRGRSCITAERDSKRARRQALLVPQRHDRIQSRGAAGGPDAEQHADHRREHE